MIFDNCNSKVTHVLFCIVLIASTVKSQDFNEILKNISSPQEAKQLVEKYPNQSVIFTFYSDRDTSFYEKRALSKKVGDTMKTGNSYVKILEVKQLIRFQVSYIAINANNLGLKQIDSIRLAISQEYLNGEKFSDLSIRYEKSFSPNIQVKDYVYSDEAIPELETEVKKYKVGEVFFVDDTAKKHYYIIKKNANDYSKVESATSIWLKTAAFWPRNR